MISKVILYSNYVVMVFDENGMQIPRYQGLYKEVAKKIVKDAPTQTKFYTCIWREEPISISIEDFKTRGGK